MKTNQTGLFGKLPAHGDFIYRDLSSTFINRWDEWLQSYVNSSQEQLGESWLEIYLTSPIWRFCLSEGVIDENVWCGILLPSVDRVGRYFPFSIVARQPAGTGPASFCAQQTAWFEKMEALALSALDGRLVIDDLVEQINTPESSIVSTSLGLPSGMANSNAVVSHPEENFSADQAIPHLLDSALTQNLKSFSLWQTAGSQHVAPCTFYCQHLPHPSGIAAMFDGQWAHWQWQPHHFNNKGQR